MELAGNSSNVGQGSLYVNDGTLALNKTGLTSVAVPIDLVVGDNDGGPGADQVVYRDTAGIGAGINEVQSIVRNINGSIVFSFNGANASSISLSTGTTAHTDSQHAEHDSRIVRQYLGLRRQWRPVVRDVYQQAGERRRAQIGTSNNNANVSVETQGAGPLADEIGNVNVTIAKSGLH